MMHQYFAIYKPFQVLTQFSNGEGKSTLKDFFDVPRDVYPVGRLDYDSEGLLLLTNDPRVNHLLLNPVFEHDREYWVQVEGSITDVALDQLRKGVVINVNGKHHKTKPAIVEMLEHIADIPARTPPIRFRINVPDSWISITLSEGKNRQVRRMTAAVSFPTLRLIRYRIGKVTLNNLQPGSIKELSHHEFYEQLSLHKPGHR
jgi:23S rRNA pseudouridine2457 synthase